MPAFPFRLVSLVSTVSIWLLVASACAAVTVNCTTVATMLYSAFHLNAAQQYRGAPEQLLSHSFMEGVKNLTKYARATRPNATSLSEVCLTDAERRNVYWYSYLSEMPASIDNQRRYVPHDYPLDAPDWWVNAPTSVTEFDSDENNFYSGPLLSFQSFSSLFRWLSSSLSRMHELLVYPNHALRGPVTVSAAARNIKIHSAPVTPRLIREMFTVGGCHSALTNLNSIHNSELPSSVFYLPFDILGTEIPPIDGEAKWVIESVWNASLREMNRLPKDVDIKKIAKLPRTVKVFHDPMAEIVRANCSTYRSMGTPMSAKNLVLKVAAISVRMRLLNVSIPASLSILNHTASYAFTCIRATRNEFGQLQLSNGFLPMYNGLFKNLTDGKNLTGYPEISTDIIDRYYGEKLYALTKLRSWGSLRYPIFHGSDVVTYEMVSEYLFDSETLANVHRSVTVRMAQRNRMRIPFFARPNPTCVDEYYHNQYAHMDENEEERCCARICTDVERLTSLIDLTELRCCWWCNQAKCVLDKSNPLTEVVDIMVQAYGWLQGGAVRLSIFR